MAWQDAPLVDAPAAGGPAAPAAPAIPAWSQAPAVGASDAPAWSKAPIVSAAPAMSEEHRSKLEDLGHQLGLTLRAALVGGASVAGIATDAVTGAVNTGLDASLGKDNGFRFEMLSHAVDNLLTKAGVANPETATERIVQAAAQGVAGGATFAGGAKAATNVASEVGKVVAEQFAAGPGLQAVSGAAGGGAQQAAKEKGGSQGAQIAAGVLGSLAPGMVPFGAKAAVRGALRGGEEGRARAADNLATFDAAGVEPTVAQVADSRLARATESLLAKYPGSAGVIAQKAQQQADQLQTSVQQISDALAPGANAITAGEAIMSGVQKFKQGFKDLQGTLYRNLDQYLPGDSPVVVTKTQEALAALNADIEGAPNLSKLFKNSRIQGIDKALQADLEEAATSGSLPYQAIKKLRTVVGNEIADNNLVSDVPRSKWTSLYGALSEDLGVAAKAAGPEAEQAWQWANSFTRMQMQRLEQLSTVVSKDAPERVFTAALSGTAEGDTLARRIVGALPKQERQEFAAAVVQRLGRATPGQQNAEGNAFSSETFLTNLNKMSASARQTIFGRTDVDGVLDKLTTIAKIAESRRDGGKVFANPSGTASGTAQMVNAGGLGAALVSGHPIAIATALGAPVAANLAARAATSDTLARAIADPTVLRPGGAAAIAEAASRAAESPPPSLQKPIGLTPMSKRGIAPLPAPAASGVDAVLNAGSIDEAIAAATRASRGGRAAPDMIAEVRSKAASAPQAAQPARAATGAAAAPQRPVPPVSMAPAADQPQPPVSWFGRAGDGYRTAFDAAMAMPGRQRMQPDYSWRVELLPSGKFRLAGYVKEQS